MAIVKMQRLQLYAMKTQREKLLDALQRAGCVELSEPTEVLPEADFAAMHRPHDGKLAEARQSAALFTECLAALRHSGVKGRGLLQARALVTAKELYDEETWQAAMKTARAICAEQKRLFALDAEKCRLEGALLQLAPWLGLDLPLETQDTATSLVVFGSVSARQSLALLPSEVAAASELCQLLYGGSDADQQHLVVVCHKTAEEAVFTVLKKYGFARINLRDWQGSAQENTDQIHLRLRELRTLMGEAEKAIAQRAGERALLELALDRAEQEIARETAKGRILQSEAALFLTGWVPLPEVPRLKEALQSFDCAVILSDPSAEEYPDVPVKLKNNVFSRPLNMVTEMYSLPAYDGVDPNPLMAPFFILFYGIMMADMGYGLLMMGFSALLLLKARPKGGMWNFTVLMGFCGISTFVMGAITGGFFGDFLPRLVALINPNTRFTSLPYLFTPLDDTISILIGAMCLGAVQILTGMVISFVKKLQDGQIMDAIWGELTWWLVFAGGALALLGVTKIVFYISCVMVLIGSGWGVKSIGGRIATTLSTIYGNVTGYFGDILSYSRLMALMLAGSVIAQVFNTLGSVTGNVFAFILISAFGNTLNLALNLLGCYVHDLRLQCLEYFGKFYKDGGRAFRPLAIDTKYVDLAK